MAPYCKSDEPQAPGIIMAAYLSYNEAGQSVSDSSIEEDNLESRENEEEVLAGVFPPPPNVLPESLPLESSLPQLLMSQTGVSEEYELVNKKTIRLRIMSKEMSLQRLSIYMPMLVELDLTGSWLHSLRDLGCNLKIKILKVPHCGLDGLDGLFGLTTLQELHAQMNSITDIGTCALLPKLRLLDISRNRVENLNEISFLAICFELRDLNLSNNPVSDLPNYRSVIMELLPGLTRFDGETLAAEEIPSDGNVQTLNMKTRRKMKPVEENVDDRSSTTVQDTKGDIKIEENSMKRARPSTSVGFRQLTGSGDRLQRPHTAGPRKQEKVLKEDGTAELSVHEEETASVLTSGGVLCGNLTAALRSRSRRNKKLGMWCDESVVMNDDSPGIPTEPIPPNENNDDEPRINPPDEDRDDVDDDDRVTEVNTLIEASRKWRIAYSKHRNSLRKQEKGSIALEFNGET